MEGSSSVSKNSAEEPYKLSDSIYSFHDPAREEKKIKAVFIFFHDILWPGRENTHVKTWMSSGTPPVCWPQAWLPTKYPEAKILSVRHNASLWKQKDTGLTDIELLAENLWQEILLVCDGNDCPIFLIGHGLGGIIIKGMIEAMQTKYGKLRDVHNCTTIGNDLRNNKEIDRLDCFLKNVKGVFYYATPSLGSTVVNATNFPGKNPLSEPLELLSPYTCRLNESFRGWRKSRCCRATAIFPRLLTNVKFGYGEWRVAVVKEASVRFDVDNYYTSVGSDYFTVCQPQDKTESSYQLLLQFFDDGMQGITDGPHSHMEDTQPRKRCMEYVEEILSNLPSSEEDGRLLNRFDLDQLKEFEDLWSKLMNGLKDAGFRKTNEYVYGQQWELA